MSEATKLLFSALKVDLTSSCHAYYSTEAARLYGAGIWVDAEGREVAVTCADPDRVRLDEGYRWKDRVYVGIVVRRLRNGPEGETPVRTVPLNLSYFPE